MTITEKPSALISKLIKNFTVQTLEMINPGLRFLMSNFSKLWVFFSCLDCLYFPIAF